MRDKITVECEALVKIAKKIDELTTALRKIHELRYEDRDVLVTAIEESVKLLENQ